MSSSNKKPVINIGVRTLVEFLLRSGDLDLTVFGTIHPADGLRAHQAIQSARPSEYTSEIPVCITREADRYTLVISGRVDGVYTYPDCVILEELKTTKKDLAVFDEYEDPLHWGQARCYAYMYAYEHRLERIDVRVTYYQIETGTTRECTQTFTVSSLETYFNDLLEQYLVWVERRVQWLITRNHSIKKLSFPFDAYRPGQEQIINRVEEIVGHGNQLFVQAPTGIGKTMAIIYGVLRTVPVHKIPVFFYLTARTTGRVAAEDAFRMLRKKGLRCRVLSLTAKKKVCFNTDRMCNGAECSFARNFYDRLPAALEDGLSHDALNRQTIGTLAQKHHICPFEYSLEISLWADCIICDYNYAFDPKVYLRRFFEEGKEDCVFLVDEAHNLVDRARDMFSAEIIKSALVDLARITSRSVPAVSRALDPVLQVLIEREDVCRVEGNPRAEREAPEDLYPALIDVTVNAEKWLKRNEFTKFRSALIDRYFEIKRFLWTAEQYNETYATCYTKTNGDLSIKLLCMDPAEQMSAALQRSRSTIFFSATLHPVTFFLESLGCDPEADTLDLPSPFDRDNLCVLIAHKISTFYKYRAFTKPDVVKVLAATVDQRVGNYLMFFPSYTYMNVTHDDFSRQRKHVKTLIQTSGMTESARERFIKEFKEPSDEHLVGFAVMGGVFAESIDLFGEQLTGAVIVGVGMPGICLERELIKQYYEKKIGAGFAFAYQYPGMIKVLQAAGRVIRSESDRGVLVLIDTRYARKEYFELLPSEWRVRYVKDHTEIAEYIQRFWRS